MNYPKPGDEITIQVDSWPSPNHIRNAANALDTITVAKYGDILRAVAEALDSPIEAQAHRGLPWADADMHEVWALTDKSGTVRPHVRATGGWRSFGRKNQLFPTNWFVAGYRLWPTEPDPNEF